MSFLLCNVDLPIIASGDYVGLMDPHETILNPDSRGPRSTGKKFTMKEFHQYRGQVAAFDGILDFNSSNSEYNGTLFRFPFRNNEFHSEIISDVMYTHEKALDLYDSLAQEAQQMLLFLNHVTDVELYDGNPCALGQPLLHITVDSHEVQGSRAWYKSACAAFSRNQGHADTYLNKCTVTVEGQLAEKAGTVGTSSWLMCSTIGVKDRQVVELASKLKVIPWVGLAAPLSPAIAVGDVHLQNEACLQVNCASVENQVSRAVLRYHKSIGWNDPRSTLSNNGFAFCFLPMSTSTGLPVHIHGYFTLSANRRIVRWPATDDNSDEANWNKHLVEHLIAPSYAILMTARCMMTSYQGSPLAYTALQESADPYALLPVMSEVKEEVWKHLIYRVQPLLSQLPVLWTAANNGMWVKPPNAYFVPLDALVPNSVVNLLLQLNCPIVCLPRNVQESCASLGCKLITPDVARECLRRDAKTAMRIFQENEHLLEQTLRYVFSNGDHNLQKLPLVPLQQTDSVGTFSSQTFYVLPKDDMLAGQIMSIQVLHGLEGQIVSSSLPSDLQAHFLRLACSNQYQLQLATADVICPNLLRAAIETWCHNPNDSSITWSPSQHNHPPASWLSCVWQYIANNGKLQSVTGLPLIAVNGPDAICNKGSVTLYPLKSSGSTVLRKTSASSKQMQSIAKDLGCTLVNDSHLYAPFDWQLNQYLPVLSSTTLFAALQFIPDVASTAASLDNAQKRCLRRYLAEAVSSSMGSLNGQQIRLLRSLPVYEIGVGSQSVTFDQLSYSNQEVFPHYSISFPSNLAFPSQILKVSEADQQLIQAVLQRPPLSIGALVQQHIFNHAVTQCNTEMRNQILMWIIEMSQPQQNGELGQLIRCNACIPASDNTLCRVDALYDPEDSKLQEFFHSCEARFPTIDFKPVFHKLRQFGLSTWHTVTQSDDMFGTFLRDRSQSVQFLHSRGMETEARQHSKLILQTVANHAQCQYLLKYVKEQRFLFCQLSRPSGYPEQLHWAGMGATQLFSPSEVCASSDLFQLASLVGSVCCIVDSTYTDSVRRLKEINGTSCFLSVIPRYVNQHFINITSLHTSTLAAQSGCLSYVSRRQMSVNSMVEYIYEFLSSTDPNCFKQWTRPCVWNSEQCLFVEKSKVALGPLEGCSLAPYRYSAQDLPCLQTYKSMWIDSGVKDQFTVEDGVQVVREIKTSAEQLNATDLDIVVNIANVLKENTQVCYVNEMYLPSKSCRLHKPEDLTYHDYYLDIPESEQGVDFIHSRITSDVARFFGVMSLSVRVAPSQSLGIDYECTGPYESITHRIKGLVEDYGNSIDVFKELIQNADDAGATEVKFLIDWRTHSTGKLLAKGMAKWQGPALYAYNNKTFSDEDLQNIGKVAGATKKQDHTKIGRFGVGFCATYHLTDVPSFITRRWLQVFDPHLKYLGERVQPNKPGMQIDFVKQREGLKNYFSDQLAPYQSVFGCNAFDSDQNGFNGTLFRFPFRQQGIVSEISTEVFTEGSKTVDSLKSSLFQSADTLLLFLQNVNKVELFECGSGATLDKMQKVFQITRSNTDGGDFERQFKIPREHFSSVSPCSQRMKIVTSVGNGKQQSQETMWQVSSAMGRGPSLQHANSQDGRSQGLVPVAEVAMKIKKEGQSIAFDSTKGTVSCFLPLPIETSLNFVVNAFFDVSKDRRLLKGVQGSGCDTWNVMLIKDALVEAVFTLLVALAKLTPDQKPDAVKKFLQLYYDLFPTAYVSKQTDGLRPYLADSFVQRLPLEERKLIWSECDGGCFWKPSDVVVLSLDFDKNPFTDAEKHMIQSFLVHQGVCIAEVPFSIRECFKQVTFEDFCHQHLFGKIDSETDILETKDTLVLFILKHLFSLIESYPWLTQLVQDTACISSKPHNALCKPDFLVDPACMLLASLYDESEGRFPADKYSDQGLTQVLHVLGMSHVRLKNEDVLDRAKSVQQVLRSKDADKAKQRSQALVAYLTECHFKPYKQYSGFSDLTAEDESLTAQLNTQPFLLAMPRPQNTTLPWFMAKKSRFSSAKSMYWSRYRYLVFVKHDIVDDQAYSGHLSDLQHILTFRQKPELPVVLGQLKDLVCWWTKSRGKRSGSSEDVDTISLAMKDIYGYFKSAVLPYSLSTPLREKDEEILKSIKAQLKDIPFIWQNDFYRVDEVFWEESCDCPPYLVKLHPVDVKILTELGVAKQATREQLLLTLKAIATDYPSQPVSDQFADFACYAAKRLSVCADASVASAELFLPDQNKVMRHSSQLIYLDDRDYSWLEKHSLFQSLSSREKMVHYHLHQGISWAVAKSLGLNNPVQALLSKFSDKKFVKGLEFGQHEDLCDRLSGILQGYHPDTSIFKEFVQNADDAGASEIAFILDRRVFSDDHLLSDNNNWKQLQKMPSLLVFNNRKFTDQDLEGITKLGQGGKRDTPDTIGRFGIGFNVAYHVTDCPMFVSHKEGGVPEHFCVFDPTLNFAPDSTVQKPGERWELGTVNSEPSATQDEDTLCSVFDSQFEPYSQDILQRLASNCPGTFTDMCEPEKWPDGFVMFRLPLTRERPASLISTISPEGPTSKQRQRVVRGCKMNCSLLKKLLSDFGKEAGHTLLFLNSVRKISIYEVSTSNRCSLIGSYQAALSVADQHKCKEFERCVRQGIECLCIGDMPQNIQRVYEVSVNSVFTVDTQDLSKRQLVEDRSAWIVSKRFGGQDLEESLLKTGFKCSFLPLGGVAAAYPAKEQSSQQPTSLFCYLPLPLDSHLPVHVNGHFWLSDSRRDLQRGSSYHDLKDWNKSLSDDVICKAYAELLLYCRGVRVMKEGEDGARCQQLDKEWYYSLFPECNVTGPLEEFHLPEQLYCYLLDNSADVLLYMSNQLQIPTWLQLTNPEGSQKGWFYSETCELSSETLLKLGMKLTYAPLEIADRIDTSLQCFERESKYEGVVTPAVVRDHLRSLCPKLDTFKGVIVEDIVPLLAYCLNDEPTTETTEVNSTNKSEQQPPLKWQDFLDGVPLMLTEDGQLWTMHEVYDGKFTNLLPHSCGHLFIHNAVWKDLSVRRTLTTIGVIKLLARHPELVVKHLQLPRDGHVIDMSQDYLQTLAEFWKYLRCVERGKRRVFCHFSVIPTIDNKLHPLSHGKRILFEEPEMTLTGMFRFPVVDFGKVFRTEAGESAQYSAFEYLFAKSNNPDDILQMLQLYKTDLMHKSIHPKEEEVMEFIRFLQASSAIREVETTIPWLKELPLFFLVSGELKAIDGYREAHGVPKDLPCSGLDEMSKAANIAFLVVPAFCEEFMKKACVTVWDRISLDLYNSVLIPLFNKLPHDQIPDLLQQHMESVFMVYKFVRYTKRTRVTWNAVFRHLKSVPFLQTPKGPTCAADLCDHTIALFEAFCPAEMFPLSPWDDESDSERLDFLGHLGLCREVSADDWLRFAQSLAQDIQKLEAGSAEEKPCIEKATLLLDNLAKRLVDPETETVLSRSFLIEAGSICCVPCRIDPEPHETFKKVVPSLERSSQKWTTLRNSVLLRNEADYQLACFHKPVLPTFFSPESPKASDYLSDYLQTLGVIELNAVVVAHNLASVAQILQQCHELPIRKKFALVQQIGQLFEAHYEYIDGFKGDGAPISAVLCDCKCIFIQRSNFSNFQLLSADTVCGNMPRECDLYPYVREVPSSCRQFKTFLKLACVSDSLKISQCLHVLRQLHRKGIGDDPNDKRLAEQAYESLVKLAREEEKHQGSELAMFESGNIPLLSMDNELIDASQVVLDDALWLGDRLNETSVKYQMVKTPPQDDYGNITLPQCLGVRLLSSIISERPHIDMENEHIICNEEQVAWSEGKEHGCKHVMKLQEILQSNELHSGILRVIKCETKKPPTDELAEIVHVRLLGVTVKCVQMIKTVLHDEHGQELPKSEGEDTFSFVWTEIPDSSEAIAYISPHQKTVDMDDLMYEFAWGINQHMGGVIRDNAKLIKMIFCDSPETIPMVLNRLRIPMYEHGTEKEPLVTDLGELVPHKGYLDNIIMCSYRENEIVKYYSLDGQLINAQVVVMSEDRDSEEDELSACKLRVGHSEDNTADVPLSQLFIAKYLQPQQATRIAKEWDLVVEVSDAEEAPSEPLSILELSIEDDEHLKVQLDDLLSQLTAEQLPNSHILYASQRLAYHLHYLCTRKKSAAFRRLSLVLVRAAEPHLELLELQKLRETVDELLKKNVDPPERWTGGGGYGGQMEADSFAHGGSGSHRRRQHSRGGGGGGVSSLWRGGYRNRDALWQSLGKEPPPQPNLEHAKMWLLQALNDYEAAKSLLTSSQEKLQVEGNTVDAVHVFPAQVCFLAHESVEKSLKTLFLALFGLNRVLSEQTNVRDLCQELQDSTHWPKDPPLDLMPQVLQVSRHYLRCRYPDYNTPIMAPVLAYMQHFEEAEEVVAAVEAILTKVGSIPCIAPMMEPIRHIVLARRRTPLDPAREWLHGIPYRRCMHCALCNVYTFSAGAVSNVQ